MRASRLRSTPDHAPTVLGDTPDPLPPKHAEEVMVAEPAAMSDEELQAAFTQLRTGASSYNDRLSNERQRALRLYNGEPFGDEEEGRSQIVLTEVADTIAAVMPTIMRTFAGAERPIEFTATAEGDEDQADQATAYVQQVVFRECAGFRAIHDAALDAAQLKVGWIRWGWDDSVEPVTESYRSLLEPQCAALTTQEGVRALRVVRRPATEEEQHGIMASPERAMVQQMPGAPLLVYDVTLLRRIKRNRARVAAVPSESVWIDANASGPDDADGIFIVEETSLSELVKLGFDLEDLERWTHAANAARTDKIKRRRDRLAAQAARDVDSKANPALRRVTYTEGWVRVDYDGDGIAELRRVQALGDDGQHIIAHEPASCVPLARLVPFAVAHRAVGASYADRVGDLQAVNSRIMRNILDSMSEAIHPRTVIKDGAVPIDDVFNTEMGAVIRERETGAIRELTKPFIGPQALPLLDVVAQIRESRTGITRGSQGFTAESLQSTAPIAVSAQISAAQDRIDLTLRWIAEGLLPLYQGVLALMAEHQDRARMVLLRGKWVPVDPRSWMGRFNVAAKVAIGRGSLAERLQVYGVIAGKQEQILQTYGPQNPLVTVAQYRNTLADMLAAAGITTPERYFSDVPPDWAPPPTTPQPTPDELLAHVEVQKSADGVRKTAIERRGEMMKALLDDDRERDIAKANAMLQAAEIIGKYPGTDIDTRALAGLLARDVDLSAALVANIAGPVPDTTAAAPAGAGPPPDVPAGAGAAVPAGAGAAAPAAGQKPQSLADARAFLPPTLIQALAQLQRAHAAAPPATPVL